MATVSSFLANIAADLNDNAPGHEFTVWSREQLLSFFHEACQLLITSNPDAFAQSIVIELVGCQDYYDVCDCVGLTNDSILGQSDSSGHVFQILKSRPDGAISRWTGRTCSPENPFRLREFSVAGNGRSIRVYPSVPPNKTVYVAARCAVLPKDDDAEVPENIAPMLIQWVLFRAKMMDAENNPAILNAAIVHRDVFLAFLGVKTPRSNSRQQ
jgi:hypothetical protein